MNKRKADYKPLLFTTTMRNPERLKSFLKLLEKFDGEILTSEVIEKFVCNVIRVGLYQPMKVSDKIKVKWKQEEELLDAEVLQIIEKNPQNHKEAGFKKGWDSRFDTWFKIAKELGFIYYEYNERIEFSTSGKMLLDDKNPENEQFVFANAFAKYYRKKDEVILGIDDLSHIKNMAISIKNTIKIMKELEEMGEEFLAHDLIRYNITQI